MRGLKEERFTTEAQRTQRRKGDIAYFLLPVLCASVVNLLPSFLPVANAQPRSGYQDSGPQVRAMQDDDTQNPAFLWVEQGMTLWRQPAGSAGKSCADCHGDIASMKGVAARAPAYDPQRARPIPLPERVNICRTEHQGAGKLAPESEQMLALTAAIGLQSRGLPVQPAADPRAAPFIATGERLFRTRQGQLDLSCAQCHDDRAGQRLGGAIIPEGHANGYPQYRLEWQGMGSFARRLRACLTGVRAEPYPADSAEAVALELYLATRAKGLNVETPAVRP